MRGVFISLEGIDGSGKTTMVAKLREHFDKTNTVFVREPGGTRVSEQIRNILLDVNNGSMADRTEALLYASARSQVVHEIIKPALEQGKIVIADRFMDSTTAYQGYGRGIDLKFLRKLTELCTGGLCPDLTILLDVDTDVAKARTGREKMDRLELVGEAFQKRIRKGYLKIADKNTFRIRVVDGNRNEESVFEDVIGHINELLLVRSIDVSNNCC